jgi:macrolide transport system ATP-binding/permease protein
MLRPILQLKGVSRHYAHGEQRVVALEDINLTLHAGVMVAIVGASGSGKSTLLNILGCLDRPSAGRYAVDGRNTARLDDDELARLRLEYFGFVFQRYQLLPNLSAHDNVAMAAVYAGAAPAERRSRCGALLERLGLGDRARHRPAELSGGQQQRVSIARALVNGARVVLADEPTGALDTAAGRVLMTLLRELQCEGHTVILVTHDLEVAAHAERIIELRDGRIVSDRANRPQADAPARRVSESAWRERPARRVGWLRSLAETFGMVRLELASHRLRNALTLLGVVIGIASVAAIMAVGEGSQRRMRETIAPLAASLLEIHRGSGWGDTGAAAIRTLVPGDLQALQAQPYVASATPLTRASFAVRHGAADANALVSGVGEGFFKVRNIAIAEGRAFTAHDISEQAQVAVINAEARRKLFPAEDPLGKVILAGSVPCVVIGVTASAFREQGANVLLPYTTAGVRLFGQPHFESITVRLAEGEDSALAEKAITGLLAYKHGARDFFVENKDALAKAYDKTSRTLALSLSLIGAIALLVGGIGVMNIMLVSVTERTREIGLRMAVGARRGDILRQFLAESVLICLIGGVLGVLLALASSYLFSSFVHEWRMAFTPAGLTSAFLCSVLVGVAFGFLPAHKASRLSPHEALARE